MKTTLKFCLFTSVVCAVVFFQNCSPTQFNMPSEVVDATCTGVDCVSAASTIPNSSSSNSTTPVASGIPSSSSVPVAAPVSASTGTLYNFVAGDKQSCENSIQQTLGKSVSCSVGGGCGISCGVPGGSCMSANPGLWGACVNNSGSTPAVSSSCQPAGSLVAYQNCQGGSYPSSEFQTGTQAWSGCCSGTVKRTCGEAGYSAANPIICQ